MLTLSISADEVAKSTGGASIFSYAGTVNGAVTLTMWMLVICVIVLISSMLNIKVYEVISKGLHWLVKIAGKIIKKKEVMYHRDIEIGKIDEKRRKVKIYRFLNDLIIDLGLKQKHATPYEFLLITLLTSLLIAIIACQMLFGSLLLLLIMYPIVFTGYMCLLYTKANIVHDSRIEAVTESENIVCNNIKDGTVVSVRNSLNNMPEQVKSAYVDFLDNVEHKNYHIKTALLELNQQLGSTADDFIKKCIVFETEEEHGMVGMFSDVVRVNNFNKEIRIKVKHKFEKVNHFFTICSILIFGFIAALILIYPLIASLYLKNPVGQILLCLDILVFIGEFVYITKLRAKEI